MYVLNHLVLFIAAKASSDELTLTTELFVFIGSICWLS